MKEELQAHATAEGVARAGVVFTGARPDAWALMGAAEAVVFASNWEGLPLAALEALAIGTPLVATEVRGLKGFLEDETTALLVPPGNADALAAAVQRVVSDGALARRLATAGRDLAARYDAKTMTAAYLPCLRAGSPSPCLAPPMGRLPSRQSSSARAIGSGARSRRRPSPPPRMVEPFESARLGRRRSPEPRCCPRRFGLEGPTASISRVTAPVRSPIVNSRPRDLVVGFEPAHVARAVVDGGARRDRSFLLIELLESLRGAEAPALTDPVERARSLIARANEHRPSSASSLIIPDPLGGDGNFNEAAEAAQVFATRLAMLLFGSDRE